MLFEPVAGHRGTWAKVIAVIIVGVAVSVMVAAGVGWVVNWVQRRRETKPLFENEEEEREPFLNGDMH